MSTLAIVEVVLREAGMPLTAREIVRLAAGRLPSRSRTPDTVVARDLSLHIKHRGGQSLFVRTSPGRFAVRDMLPALGLPALGAADVANASPIAGAAALR